MEYPKFIRFLLCLALISSLMACAESEVKKEAGGEFEAGLAYFNNGQYKESIPHFEHATRLLPEFWEAYMFLGRAYPNLERWHEALPPLRSAFRLEPQEAQRKSAGIIMDIYFKNAYKIDQEAQSQFMELLKLK